MARSAKAIVLDEATKATQAAASNPRASAWVSANAGSGKTFVLAQRVVRLLLAGTDPSRILCLTFTRAAAAEMAKRVFARLAEWATLDDAKLAREIAAIEGRKPKPDELAAARRLFAKALETPGGLKVQTIHAFCERLLHQFPFEANVAGHFQLLDEADAAATAEEARRHTIGAAAAAPESPLGRAFATVLAYTSDFGLDLAVKEFLRMRDRLRTWIHAAGTLDRAIVELRDGLGLGPDDTPATLRASILHECAFDREELSRLATLLGGGGKNDQAALARLAPCIEEAELDARVAGYLDFWQTGGGDLRVAKSLVSKAVKDHWPELEETLARERARLEALLDRLTAADCHASTAAMLRLADAAIGEYERRKRIRGVLDFDDLIVKTASLLTRPDASRWVQYKLDRGLDHILVDEAQDTSPRAWQVVGALVEEFFAGEGASPKARTLFAVGDEKQSIFSFQGAVPARFSATRAQLRRRAEGAGLGWSEPQLHLSFRSVPKVLAAVDKVFGRVEAHRGLASEPVPTIHTAQRRGEPGQVVLWPQFEQPEREVPEDWAAPLDHLGKRSPEVQLADRIARTVNRWTTNREKIEATGALVKPGSILVLSRNRGAQTDAINRELKKRGVPIAGADRIAIADHIAVQDLIALGRVVLLPEDDLSLAAVLKSPLIGMSEDDLFAIAQGRGHSTLWDALGLAALRDGGVFAEARRKLDAWRSDADTLGPHQFFARILGPDQGRRRILARLGAEADDVLDEFLAEALAFEASRVPSLEGFLSFLVAANTEIRRDTDTLRDEVRVMTVHGAKGLEADIVFVVDTGAAPVHSSHDPRIVSLRDDRDGSISPLVWMRSSRVMPAVVRQRVDALRELAREEYRRLLYVAMTRARDRLYVVGTRKDRATDDAGGWYGLVEAGLKDELTDIDAPEGPAREWRREERREPPPKVEQTGLPLRAVAPAWLSTPAPSPVIARPRLTPSAVRLAEDADTPQPRAPWLDRRSDSEMAAALDRGRLVHRLLQSLPDFPVDARESVGARYLAATAPAWAGDERAGLLAEVIKVIADPSFAPVFTSGSRAEIDIAGSLAVAGGTASVSGRVDRLAVTPDRVLIVDYKTNRPAPQRLEDSPDAYIAQLALYRAILQRLYPEHVIAAAILWTDLPRLMEIPSAALDSALAGVTAGTGTRVAPTL